MSDAEKIEFKTFLIGDENVGRKTIINRFRIMKCTETKENQVALNSVKNINQNNKPNFQDDIKLLIRKRSNDHKIKINSQKPFEEDIDNKENQCKTQITFLKRKIENLTNFTKIFTIAKNYFEFNFYNCPTAENLEFNDIINEEEDSERIHKMKFDKLKRFIRHELQKPRKMNMQVKILFMFIFDITNAKSLERIKIYYEELKKIYLFDNENFSIPKTFYTILIANKIDLKVPFEEIDRDLLDSLIAQTKVKNYEISGKLNFNFEKFFEKMFLETFEKDIESLRSDYFKNRFNKLLFTTRTFSKETRHFFRMNQNPGPDNYNNNPFDLNDDKGVFIFLFFFN